MIHICIIDDQKEDPIMLRTLLNPFKSEGIVLVETNNQATAFDALQQVLQRLQQPRIEKLVLHTSEGVYFLPITEVYHIQSSGNYTTIETIKGEKIVVCANLGQFDHLTADCGQAGCIANLFFRIHQSHIIRISNVRKLLRMPDGEYVVLENGVKVPIARRRREAFLAAMNQ
jgi:DNA-binding LytR/AlgR family response regulator